MTKKNGKAKSWTLPSRHGGYDPEPMDTTPIEMPLGYCRPTPLHDLIAAMVRQEVENNTREEFDSLEEADDFEEDDPDTLDLTKYELQELNEDIPLDLDHEQDVIEEEESQRKVSPKEVLDRAYGPGNYPAHWITGDRSDPDTEEPD